MTNLIVNFASDSSFVAESGQRLAPTTKGNTTATVGRYIANEAPIPFSMLNPALQGSGVTMVYLDPAGNMHNLSGPNAGLEGARICTQVFGDQQWHFEQVSVNSPYILGAQIQRQNYPERKFNFGVIIGSHAPPMSEYQFRLAEDYWWSGQDESNDGWFGVYTRYSGWRWIPVRPEDTVRTPQKMDSTAYGNNSVRWDITWVAQRPYFTKVARYRTFQASTGVAKSAPNYLLTGVTPGLASGNYYWGTLPLANAGDLPSYVSYFVSSPGQAVVQDNSSDRLVPLPPTVSSVGTFMCDSEPGMRTLTAANDPLDNVVFDLIRQSTILNFFLSAATSGSTPLQLQFQNRFIYTIPPKSEVSLTVGHSNPNGVITAIVPQRFKRSR